MMKISSQVTVILLFLTLSLFSQATVPEIAPITPQKLKQKFFSMRTLPVGINGAFHISKGERMSYSYKIGTNHVLVLQKNNVAAQGPRSNSPSVIYTSLKSEEAENLIAPQYLQDSSWENCWRIFAGGLPMEVFDKDSWCQDAQAAAKAEVKELKSYSSQLDPIQVARALVLKYGKVLGRDSYFDYSSALDQSQGYIEKRVTEVARSKSTFKGSLMNMSREDKARTGVVFLPGYGNGGDRYGKMLEKMSVLLHSQEGFTTYFARTQSKQGSNINTPIILSSLKEALRKNDRIVMVMISKGTQDFLSAMNSEEYKRGFSESEKDKIKIVISLSGITRFSHVSWFITESHTLKGKILSWIHLLKMSSEERSLNGAKALARDPLDALKYELSTLSTTLPEVTWVSGNSFPEGPFGFVEQEKLFKKSDSVYPFSKFLVGPVDGVMETASGVLPPGTGIKQWIVRLYGSHQSFDGWFEKERKTRVSQKWKVDIKDEDLYQPGYDLLNNYFKALPASLLTSN